MKTQIKMVASFATSSQAWSFMRACDALGIVAGFPGLKDHSVKFLAKGMTAALIGAETALHAGASDVGQESY